MVVSLSRNAHQNVLVVNFHLLRTYRKWMRHCDWYFQVNINFKRIRSLREPSIKSMLSQWRRTWFFGIWTNRDHKIKTFYLAEVVSIRKFVKCMAYHGHNHGLQASPGESDKSSIVRFDSSPRKVMQHISINF